MWPFNRKPRNRHFERDQRLDTGLSTSQNGAARRRLVSVAFAFSLGTLLLLFLLWRGGNWMLTRFVYQNPAYALQVITIETDGVLAPEQIRRWAGVNRGDNLLALDLAQIKRDLELAPVIENVSVERILPRTLHLRITERTPIAQVLKPTASDRADNAVFTLDEEGYVTLPLLAYQRQTPAPTNEFLPIITGVSQVELRPGRMVESTQVKAALQLIQAFDNSPMVGWVDLHWIDLSFPDTLLITTSQGSKVTFSTTQFDAQLRRWRAAYDYGQKLGKVVSSLDLSVANNIPATWIDASTAPPPAPKIAKPNRKSKKKNV